MLKYNVRLEDKTLLVTGAAGFIGANLVKRLLNDFSRVKIIGMDSITDYYDIRLRSFLIRERLHRKQTGRGGYIRQIPATGGGKSCSSGRGSL